MKAFFKFLLIVALFGFGAVVAGFQYLSSWQSEPVKLGGDVVVELKPGMPLRLLSQQLEDKNAITSSDLFVVWMKLNRDYPKLQAGTYQFKGEISPEAIVDKMKRGDIYVPLVLQVIIPEGFTLQMLNNRLTTKGVGKLKDLQRLVRDKTFIRSLGIKSTSLEGYTYPATYSFEKLPSAEEFYRKTVKTFFEKIPPDYETQLTKVGLTLNQAVTFASLIELETMRDEEKPIIAEVIWSRLKKGDVLGIDAAVIYGIDNYDGDIRWKDLKNKNNPYNTRIHRGLPPTAIGAVSRSSLEAVLNPTNLGYYYYVLDSADQTRHAFSKSLGEHNALVKKLLQAGGVNRLKRPQASE
jgi:UPF0755 protein